MAVKIFGDNTPRGTRKITIRKLSKSDLRKAEEFLDFINSLVSEEAKISLNKKVTLKEEKEFLKNLLKQAKNKTKIYLVAECQNKVIGVTSIEQDKWRKNHIGNFGITIRDGYRGLGLGKYLMSEVIKLAKKELKPIPKVIKLEVYVDNIPAINLYKKMGFEIFATLPKQIQHKGKLIGEFIMLKFL